jgi:hypothetical protein
MYSPALFPPDKDPLALVHLDPISFIWWIKLFFHIFMNSFTTQIILTGSPQMNWRGSKCLCSSFNAVVNRVTSLFIVYPYLIGIQGWLDMSFSPIRSTRFSKPKSNKKIKETSPRIVMGFAILFPLNYQKLQCGCSMFHSLSIFQT